jgi:hypothetical protein
MKQGNRLQVVETQDYLPPKRKSSFKRRASFWAVKWSLIAITAIAIAVWGSFQLVGLWNRAEDWARATQKALMAKVTKVEVRRELVRAEAVPLSQLIAAVSKKYQVPSVVLQAVIEQESGGGEHLYRFEPAKYAQLKAKTRMADSEVRMLASSHGVAHVMGFNAEPRCGVHWSRLYDTATGMECGAKLLKENIARHQAVRNPSRRIWLALRDYNGAGADAEAYANTVMARIGELLLEGIGAE